MSKNTSIYTRECYKYMVNSKTMTCDNYGTRFKATEE